MAHLEPTAIQMPVPYASGAVVALDVVVFALDLLWSVMCIQ
jgi:hypothetical protein